IDNGSTAEPLKLSWAELEARCRKVAGLLQGLGVQKGDRVAIQLPQGWEALASHIATYSIGAIAVPLATQFGPQAIAYRIAKARPKVFVATHDGIARWNQGRGKDATSTIALVTDKPTPFAESFEQGYLQAAPCNELKETGTHDPAMMLFTSGTTGQPKGVLHGHRVLLGHLPGIQLAQELMPKPDDVFWTPSDWAWAGGLLNALLPALYFGVPVVAANAPRFSADWALSVLSRNKVTNAFLPPTAIRIIANHKGKTPSLFLRAVGAAGEQLGAQTHKAAREIFNAPVNEFYGQTECNTVIGSSHWLGINHAASMGKATPGHEVQLLKEDGTFVRTGEGEIVIKADTPVAMLEYFEDPDATGEKITDGWIRTGDLATCDEDGWFTFKSRNDDIITSAGYRIGPSEIEECLRSHDAVLEAAVVGIADKERTESVAAFVKVTEKAKQVPGLEDELTNWVRTRLSAHLYPRSVELVDHIPTTESGKIMRRVFRNRG
ncbi:MAG: AMP-binding protein, partial [Pseudomonadota bacterium]